MNEQDPCPCPVDSVRDVFMVEVLRPLYLVVVVRVEDHGGDRKRTTNPVDGDET